MASQFRDSPGGAACSPRCSATHATIRVTVETAADFPSGVSDTIKRGVSENATSLGFKTKDWE